MARTRAQAALTHDPINVAALIATVPCRADGAVAVFTGIVRDHSDGRPVLGLDYEAYTPMAERELHRIAAETLTLYRLNGMAVVHRTGSLRIGEVSVVVVCASPHRDAALDACRHAIEAVKRDVPIWKREHHADGAHWVDARAAE
jgi:molybdopterin synthase catalytic subunit